ncbi:MAG: hypothetical protein Kow0025_18560 [Thermodesulfovibrionales bacterium]
MRGRCPLPSQKYANGKAEEMRLRARYRDAVLKGHLSPSAPGPGLRRLVGPDCAYHLYRHFGESPRGAGER